MLASGKSRTDLLLVFVLLLLLASMAVPLARRPAPAASPPACNPTVECPHGDELVALAREVRLFARAPGAAPAAAPAEGAEDEIVIRIPGDLAGRLGIGRSETARFLAALEALARQVEEARPSANETAAVATCRNLCSAQAQFQAVAKADVDRDGTGEFGGFVEMSGAREIRGVSDGAKLNPPVLSGAFRTPDQDGLILRSGYYYRVFLPDSAGTGIPIDRDGFQAVSADRAETTWCMYAWPVNYGVSGTRTFAVNQTGDVLSTDAREYSGRNGPSAGAAFLDGGIHSIAGLFAVGRAGQDGHEWKHVN